MGNPGKKANLWLDRLTTAHALRCVCASFLLVFTGCMAGPPAVLLPADFANEHSPFFPPSEKGDKLPAKTDGTLRSGQPAAETGFAGPDKAEDQPAKEPAAICCADSLRPPRRTFCARPDMTTPVNWNQVTACGSANRSVIRLKAIQPGLR